MGQASLRRRDRLGRAIQDVLGSGATELTQAALGENGTRFVRELLGRNPRHRVQLTCNKQSFGGEGHAWAVDPSRLSKDSVVYSVGVGDDISFDLALIERFGLDV